MKQLIDALNSCRRVTVVKSEEKDFLDYEFFFNLFYCTFEEQIMQNHVSSCSIRDVKNNELIVKF